MSDPFLLDAITHELCPPMDEAQDSALRNSIRKAFWITYQYRGSTCQSLISPIICGVGNLLCHDVISRKTLLLHYRDMDGGSLARCKAYILQTFYAYKDSLPELDPAAPRDFCDVLLLLNAGVISLKRASELLNSPETCILEMKYAYLDYARERAGVPEPK